MCVEVSATPHEVLQRLLRERPLWRTDLQQEKVLETPDKQTDVYQCSYYNMAPQPSSDYVVLRSGSMKSNICKYLPFKLLLALYLIEHFKLLKKIN